ncbi:hypothetical protein, partial [Escherichia coli]|uniref:hypothetical protein n=1 Tax=Escherichia coli TaxID=562 RepID=UPI00201A3C03
MLLLTNQMQEVQVFFVLVQYVINQLFLIPAHYIIILAALFEIDFSVTNGAIVIHTQRLKSDPGG